MACVGPDSPLRRVAAPILVGEPAPKKTDVDPTAARLSGIRNNSPYGGRARMQSSRRSAGGQCGAKGVQTPTHIVCLRFAVFKR
jgi:hypothetical protein